MLSLYNQSIYLIKCFFLSKEYSKASHDLVFIPLEEAHRHHNYLELQEPQKK